MPDLDVDPATRTRIEQLIAELLWRLDHGAADTTWELYTEDAVSIGPLGQMKGQEAIREWGRGRAALTGIVGRHIVGGTRLAWVDGVLHGWTQYLTFRDSSPDPLVPASVGEFRSSIGSSTSVGVSRGGRSCRSSVARTRRRTRAGCRRRGLVKRDVRGGAVPVLLHQALASTSVTEWALAGGYDGVIVDLQHGEVGLEAACGMLRATPRSVAHAYARVGAIDTAPILRLLDSGARGIVAPTVESAEQAHALVTATKYPPLGGRSLGPSRPQLYEGAVYTEAGNAAVSAIVQIETATGVDRAEEILSVPGLDSVYIGPADLAVTYGLPGRATGRRGLSVRRSSVCRPSPVRAASRSASTRLARLRGRPHCRGARRLCRPRHRSCAARPSRTHRNRDTER